MKFRPMTSSTRQQARWTRPAIALVAIVVTVGFVATSACNAEAGPGKHEALQRTGSDTQQATSKVRTPPWPTAKNTGAQGRLREVPGRTITTDGAVMRNVHVTGQVTIRADDVTLENVYVKTNSYYGVLVW